MESPLDMKHMTVDELKNLSNAELQARIVAFETKEKLGFVGVYEVGAGHEVSRYFAEDDWYRALLHAFVLGTKLALGEAKAPAERGIFARYKLIYADELNEYLNYNTTQEGDK